MKAKTISRRIVLIGLLNILLCFGCGTIAWAAIPQQHIRCMGCHSKSGGGELLTQYSGNQGCINCHSSSEYSTTYELDLGGGMGETVTVPIVVFTGTSAPTNYLSGGNFWWVKEGFGDDDTKGHNVFSGEADDYLTDAPGNSVTCADAGSCHQNLYQTSTSDQAGLDDRQGCTKCHMVDDDNDPTGFHHADDSNLVVGSETADTDGYFRFLKGHQDADSYGVCGIEDTDWQKTTASNDHNEYLGYAATKTSEGGFCIETCENTMTGFCTGCHGNFHVEQAGGNWIRHPSDAVLCSDGLSGCEMAAYTTYSTQVPVARPDLTDWSGPSETVNPETDMAMCLSCHRAHGSPYPKMLRWDLGGCFNCHTNK